MPSASTLEGLLEISSKRSPSKIALEDNDHFISYKQLNQDATKVSEILSCHQLNFNDRVCILLSKTYFSVATIFGVLKAKGTYVPLDIGSPAEKNEFIIEDSGAAFIITTSDHFEKFTEAFKSNFQKIEIPDNPANIYHRKLPAKDQNKDNKKRHAYILYTSGTTGTPKGALISMEAAVSFVNWGAETFFPSSDDRFSSHAPFHFDLSILDIFLSIKQGATLILIDEQMAKSPIALAPFIAQKKITIWYSAPSILSLMVLYGKLEKFDFSTIKKVLFAGEVFPVKYLRSLKSYWTEAVYFNLYGPTETNVCTFYKIPDKISPGLTEPFPIGKSCDHVTVKMINEIDGEGELAVSGSSLMEGYWKRSDLTNTVFFHEDGQQWYCTGDIAKQDENENFIFLGRKDRMIKKNGYRVELGEIEASIINHSNVAEVAVIACKDKEDFSTLYAFMQLREQADLSKSELRQFCKENLPSYMIPEKFVILEELPKTSTGKIDYRSLSKSIPS